MYLIIAKVLGAQLKIVVQRMHKHSARTIIISELLQLLMYISHLLRNHSVNLEGDCQIIFKLEEVQTRLRLTLCL